MASALFGKTRRRVLNLFVLHADQTYYLREVARQAGTGLGAVQRELAALVKAGIVRRTTRGNQVFFQADRDWPAFAELRELMGQLADPQVEQLEERLPEQLL